MLTCQTITNSNYESKDNFKALSYLIVWPRPITYHTTSYTTKCKYKRVYTNWVYALVRNTPTSPLYHMS